MVSMIEKESIDKNKWVTKEEFVDMLAVAQSLPGIFAVNFSVSIGDKLKGFKGSLAAALGTIMPSFIIILAIAMFLTPETIMTNDTLNSIFKGIRPCRGGIDYRTRLDNGKNSSNKHKDNCHTNSRSLTHILRPTSSFKSDNIYCPRSSGRIYLLYMEN